MALSESGGTIRRRTAGSRHLEQMNAVRTQREPAKRYMTFPAGLPAVHGGILARRARNPFYNVLEEYLSKNRGS